MKLSILTAMLLLMLASTCGATVATKPKSVAKTPVKRVVTAPTKHALTPAELAAKAELDKMAATLKASTGITYAANVTLTSPMSPTGPPKQFATAVTVEKSGKASITMTTSPTLQQQIIEDGTNLTVYDSGISKYSTVPSGNGLPSSVLGIYRTSQALYPTQPDAFFTLQMGMTFPVYYVSDQFDIGGQSIPGITTTISSKTATVGGKAATVVTETLSLKQATVSFAYSIDPTTNLPIAFNFSTTLPGGKMQMSLDEQFTNFQLLNAPAVASTYVFAPPTGATLVAAAAAPPSPASQPSRLLAKGTVAPDFTVSSEANKPVKLSDFKGKVVVVDFWATWCPPCQASLPHTDAIAKLWQSKGVVFLPICTSDTKTAFTGWLKTHTKMTMQFYFDPAGQSDDNISNKLYGVDGIPTQYVIGADGKVITSFVGYDAEGDPTENSLTGALKIATKS